MEDEWAVASFVDLEETRDILNIKFRYVLHNFKY